MAGAVTLTIRVRFPWWTRPYLRAIALFAWTFGVKPDPERVAHFIMKHTRIN